MTVLLSFEEKTDDARACAQSGHCLFKMLENPLTRSEKFIIIDISCSRWKEGIDNICLLDYYM